MSDSLSPHASIARDHLHLRSAVSQPVLSPDGVRVAAVVTTIDLDENTTRSCVWLDGEPLTAGPNDAEPVWSPDGRWLAFTSHRDEDKARTTLHILPVNGAGETRTVCVMADGIGEVAWSPSGRMLAFTSRTRDARYEAKDLSWQPPRKMERFFGRLNGEDWVFDRPQHVYVVDVDGTGTPRNLTPGPFQHHGVAWLPDSSAVVTSAARHETWDRDLAADLYLVAIDGEITGLTHQSGLYSGASVSPDGTRIAFRGDDNPGLYPQNTRIGIMNLDGSDRRWISEGLDRTFACMSCERPPIWLDDTTLLAPAENRGEAHLYRLSVDGQAPVPVTTGPITVTGFDAVCGALAVTRSSVERPGELWLIDEAGNERRITHVTKEWLGWERFIAPCTSAQVASAQAATGEIAPGAEGEIDAWIMRPADFDPAKRYPVLLNVHGGPFAQYGETYFDEAQMQAAAGFVVIMSNPRGGSGRHTAWGQAIIGPKHPDAPGSGWGTVDIDDLLSVLDTALDRFEFCDRERVGMLGGSYGGYIATMLAARHGDRFRAICSERAVNNLLTEEWSSDIGTMFRAEHGVDPVDDPAEYLRMSPSTLARDITVPMLIIHSEEDWRCPINQAEELWVTLRLLQRDVTFYRFPGENHELTRDGSPVHRQMRAEIVLDFFAERLAAVTASEPAGVSGE